MQFRSTALDVVPEKRRAASQLCAWFSLTQSPYLRRRQRHVDVIDAQGREGVDDGADDGGCRANGAGFADAFEAERIYRRRRFSARQLETRQRRGAGDGVVHETAIGELAIVVVDNPFVQRLAEALDDAALHLAFDQ